MLAPSRIYSADETFPVEQPSPIQQITAAFNALDIDSEELPATPPVWPTATLHMDIPSSLVFPTAFSDLPNPLEILNSSLPPPLYPPLAPTIPSAGLPPQDPVIHIVGELSKGIKDSQYSFLVSSEPILAAQELPEIEKDTFSNKFVDSVLKMKTSPSQSEWIEVQNGVKKLHNRYQRTLARCVMQNLHCKRLRTTLATREKRKYHGTNAQRVLGTREGRIMTGPVMLNAVEEDDRLRAAKQAKKQHLDDLKALRAEKKEWRDAETADRNARYQEAVVEWEAKCQHLAPRQRKPKKPTKSARPATPSRFDALSRRRVAPIAQPVSDSDDNNWCSDDNQTEDDD
ncbi:hypothetical protein FRC18_008839 [Serendipita sp. 400]|nr:hypothetical protein FRC18_008839 [Serendipita sp. 400]